MYRDFDLLLFWLFITSLFTYTSLCSWRQWFRLRDVMIVFLAIGTTCLALVALMHAAVRLPPANGDWFSHAQAVRWGRILIGVSSVAFLGVIEEYKASHWGHLSFFDRLRQPAERLFGRRQEQMDG